MNHEEPIRDQAEKLRKRIKQVAVEENSVASDATEKLPPRSRHHNQNQKKTKVKVKYPVIRILALFFVLLPIVVFSVYTYNQTPGNQAVDTVSSEEVGFETVSIDAPENEAKEEEAVESSQKVGDDETSVSTDLVEETSPGAELVQQEQELTPAAEEVVVSEPVPAVEASGSTAGTETPSQAPENVVYHTVATGETLYRIAMKYYQSQQGVDMIRKANNIQNNEISVGQKLIIPMK